MTDDELRKLMERMGHYATQLDVWGVDAPTFAAAASAIRQVMTERDAAEDFIRRQIHPSHRCEQHMSLPPICSRSYAAQSFIAEARAKRR